MKLTHLLSERVQGDQQKIWNHSTKNKAKYSQQHFLICHFISDMAVYSKVSTVKGSVICLEGVSRHSSIETSPR